MTHIPEITCDWPDCPWKSKGYEKILEQFKDTPEVLANINKNRLNGKKAHMAKKHGGPPPEDVKPVVRMKCSSCPDEWTETYPADHALYGKCSTMGCGGRPIVLA